MTVAPHAGAWIETNRDCPKAQQRFVAPHAGAWIETYENDKDWGTGGVAPHAGAWIETAIRASAIMTASLSHPMRVRGLKPKIIEMKEDPKMSHPMRVRGLKRGGEQRATQRRTVAPHAGAWIETYQYQMDAVDILSHPMRVRGLKLEYYGKGLERGVVAPHAGAWIETTSRSSAKSGVKSHPMRVRGLKQHTTNYRTFINRRTPCGCVD